MISYGFYNSVDHDRKYSAMQFGSMFDGLIRDGIFMSIGTCFRVVPAEDMMIIIGVGKAWFNRTWTWNDAPLPMVIDQSEILLDRIDAVVLDINSNQNYRKNDIIIIKGTPSKNPEKPALINDSTRHQYPLAYIYVEAEATSLRPADITSMIGTSETPYVTGILDTVNIDALLDQWQDQYLVFYEEQTEKMISDNEEWNARLNEWYDTYSSEMNDVAEYWKALWHEWYHMYTNSSAEEFSNWKNQQKEAYTEWLEELQTMLEPDIATNLANEVTDLKKRVSELEQIIEDLESNYTIYSPIRDSDNDFITDSEGDPIKGSVIFVAETTS